MTQAMRFDVTATDRASDAFNRLAANVEKLEQKLKNLDKAKADPKVTLDGLTTAEKKIDQLKAKLSSLSNTRVRVDLDVADSSGLAALAASLGRLSNAKVKVDVSIPAGAVSSLERLDRAMREIDGRTVTATVNMVGLPGASDASAIRRAAKALRELEGIGTINIVVNVEGAVEALVAVSRLREELNRLPGSTRTTVNVDVDGGALNRIGSLATSLLKVSTAAGVAGVALASATGAVSGLASVLASAAGVAGLLPGALVAGGVAAATLKVGLMGVSDALKESDPKKFAEALKELSPAAANFAKQVRSIGPAWKEVQLDVQNRLFAGLAVEMGKLSSTYLPSMRSGLGGVATQFNLLGKDLVGFATSAKTVSDVDTIFRNTTRSLEAARPAAVNLAAAFTDIAVVGTGMLPELANGFTNVTERFRTFIAQARESGQLQQWIQGGLDTLQQLGSVAGNVGSILGSVFTASRSAGADFLTTLDRVTEGVARFMQSGQGQSAMVAFFTEARATVDALLPGLAALGTAAAQSMQAFSQTGGLQAAAAAFTRIAETVAPLIPQLGQLAGETLGVLASAASNAASALSPIVGAVSGVLSALGPVAPAVLAMVVAFKALSPVTALVAGLGASVATMAGRLGASEAATTRIGAAFSKVGGAIPLLGAALVGLSIAYDQVRSKADEAARAVADGSMTMQEAVASETTQIENRNAAYRAANVEGQEFASVQDSMAGATTAGKNALTAEEKALQAVEAGWQKHLATLGPVARAKAEVARAEGEYQDKLREFGPASSEARSAADNLSAANGRLEAAQKSAGDAAQSHTEKLVAQADAMRSQIGTALGYEEAVRRTGEAHKAAADALKANGANSDEYKAAVLDLARAMLSQADAARAQGEAIGGAEAGTKAFNTEILRAADTSTQQGRDAFVKLASAMDTAGLASLSATAQMSGLKTEIITLPDGRKVTVVVASERSQLDTTTADLNALAAQKFVGTITINGDPLPFRDQFFQSVTLANGTTAMLKLDADRNPISATIDGVVYQINATTGIMTIQGDPAPGKANLDGLKLTVDSTTGVMKLDADPAGAHAKTAAEVTFANGSTGVITIDGNPATANGKTTAAVQFADGSKGTISIDGNPTPVNGKIQATVTYANGSKGTITLNPNDLVTPVINRLKQPTFSTHTIRVTQTGEVLGSGNTGLAGGGLIGYAGGGMVGAARGLVLPGYAPGRDTVPAQVRGGGPRVMLSPGEAVLVPELVRQIGPRNILAANATASGGRPATVVGSLGMAGGGTTGAMPAATQVFDRILDAQSSRPGAVPGLDAARLTALSNAGVEKRLDALVQLLERRGAGASITVNDSSGDPAETARSTMLALRLS